MEIRVAGIRVYISADLSDVSPTINVRVARGGHGLT